MSTGERNVGRVVTRIPYLGTKINTMNIETQITIVLLISLIPIFLEMEFD
jgi:ACR3 family arsenite efflux pump ArsB